MRTQMQAALLALVLLAPLVRAQTATGEVNGNVTDKTSGAVVGATVTLTNLATRIESTRSTIESGGFLCLNVQPGSYILRAGKPGFKETEIAAFEVGVSQAATLNIRLEVGELAETVEVKAEGGLIQNTST